MIDEKAKEIIKQLKDLAYRVKYDDNDNQRPGWKFAEYEMKGVPVRITLEQGILKIMLQKIARRDTKEKRNISLDGAVDLYC